MKVPPPIPGASCPICNTSMFREKSLTAHVKAHLKGSSPLLAEKWACSVCKRQYGTRQGAANHFSQTHVIAFHQAEVLRLTDASSDDGGRSSQPANQLAPSASQADGSQDNSCSYWVKGSLMISETPSCAKMATKVAVSDTLAAQDNPTSVSSEAPRPKSIPRLPWSKARRSTVL